MLKKEETIREGMKDMEDIQDMEEVSVTVKSVRTP